MGFLRLLAKSTYLELLSEDDYKRLIKEMLAALNILYGNDPDESKLSTPKSKF